MQQKHKIFQKEILTDKSFGIELSSDSDSYLFDDIAKFIEQKLNVKFTEKLDGLDQRYWDFMYNNCLLTLHLEHYLGLSIYSSKINEQSIDTIRDIVIKIENNFNK